MKRIDLAQKIGICEVITLAIYLHCDAIRHLPVQIWFVYFSLIVQPLPTNFEAAASGLKHPASYAPGYKLVWGQLAKVPPCSADKGLQLGVGKWRCKCTYKLK